MSYTLVHADCLSWLETCPDNHFHAVLTDPPFGLEYQTQNLSKKRDGGGGSWRIPRAGRAATPRFTELSKEDLEEIKGSFEVLAVQLLRVLRPGGHILMASNPLVSPWMFSPFNHTFERRGEVIRLIQTLRGGDRPKGAEAQHSNITVMPRSAYEPWGLFRKPISEPTVAKNLEVWSTGGLHRVSHYRPFTDVVRSEFPTKEERKISSHPSLKPQSWLRPMVRALLPYGGSLLDPFAGSGSTLAAAEALGFSSVGIERDQHFHEQALKTIPLLSGVEFDLSGSELTDALLSGGLEEEAQP